MSCSSIFFCVLNFHVCVLNIEKRQAKRGFPFTRTAKRSQFLGRGSCPKSSSDTFTCGTILAQVSLVSGELSEELDLLSFPHTTPVTEASEAFFSWFHCTNPSYSLHWSLWVGHKHIFPTIYSFSWQQYVKKHLIRHVYTFHCSITVYDRLGFRNFSSNSGLYTSCFDIGRVLGDRWQLEQVSLIISDKNIAYIKWGKASIQQKQMTVCYCVSSCIYITNKYCEMTTQCFSDPPNNAEKLKVYTAVCPLMVTASVCIYDSKHNARET